MRAVAVEDMQIAVLALEGDQAGAEDIQAVRLAVTVLGGRPQAMPASRVAGLEEAGFDAVECAHLVVLR
ncbi:hypothetical protein D3C84_1277620 [compost metagenome]